MGPFIADTPGVLDAFFARLATVFLRYCGYLGERDFRFGE